MRFLDDDDWERVRSNMPPSAEERLAKLQPLGLSENQIEALLGAELDDIIHDPFGDGTPLPEGVSAKAWTSLILDRTVNEIASKAGIPENDVPYALLCLALTCREQGNMTREGVIPLSSKALNQGVWPTDRDVCLLYTSPSPRDRG